MHIKDYMKTLSPEQREQFADKAGTSVGYLYLLSGGHRKAGALLARRISDATQGAVSVNDLRPDIFGAITEKAAA